MKTSSRLARPAFATAFVPTRSEPRHLGRSPARPVAGAAAARTIGLFLQEARPPVQAIFAIRFAVASQLFVRPSVTAVTGLVGWTALAIAVYVLNGITDLTADSANASTRPLASGRLSPAAARRGTGVLFLVGLTSCALAGPGVLVAALGFTALGLAYSVGPCLKATATGAALVIGLGAASTYAAGLLCRGTSTPGQFATVLVVAVWITAACSSKDFSDVAGDAAAGRSTLPVRWGARRAVGLLGALLLGCVMLAVLAAATMHVPVGVVALVGAGSVALVATLLRLPRTGTRKELRRAYRTYMWVQWSLNAALVVTT